MKIKIHLLLIGFINAITGVYAYDFAALNEDGVPIYYNFSEDGTSVAVTYKASLDLPTGISNESYCGEVVIPESVMYDNQIFNVTAIADSAFYQCFALTGITIPNNVTAIGNYAFTLCVGLTNISIPVSVITIGNGAFESCMGLQDISIPESVITIGESAFAGCTRVTNIIIGENVSAIKSGTFYACESITNIIIPKNVIAIGASAFNFCLNLNEFIVSEQNMDYSTVDGVLFNKDKTVLIAYPNAKSPVYTIPGCVSTIGSCAFRLCQNLTDITIPNSVTDIEASAFYGTKLNNIIIPDRVSTIGDFVFGACLELKKITIPNNNISFGDCVFYWDDALEEIYNLSPIPQSIGMSSFTFVDTDQCKLFIPKGFLNDYKKADVWKNFKNIVEKDYVSTALVSMENILVFPIKDGISINCNDLVYLEVFSMAGRKVYQSTFRGYKEIPLKQGVYAVCINGKNRKILVR